MHVLDFIKLIASLCTAGLYGAGLYLWIYRARLWPGLAAMLGLYPLLLSLTRGTPWFFLRVIPILGVAMFFHRHGLRTLTQIRLLWFTTLSVLAVHIYYLMVGVY